MLLALFNKIVQEAERKSKRGFESDAATAAIFENAAIPRNEADRRGELETGKRGRET